MSSVHNLYWHTHDVLDHLVNRNFCTIATPAPCSTYAHCPNGDDGDARRVYSPADLSPKCPGPTTLQTGFLLLPGGLGLCAPAVGSLLDGAYSPRGGKHVAVMRSLIWLWNWLRNRPASAITCHRNRYILKRSRSLDELLL